MNDESENPVSDAAKGKALKGAAAEAERRRQRAAKQLRMNLQRRKAQVRARREGEPDERGDGLLRSEPKPNELAAALAGKTEET